MHCGMGSCPGIGPTCVRQIAGILERRIELLTSLPLPTLERMAVQ